MLEPKASTTTFGDCTEVEFIPYLVNLLRTSEVRLGVVWDRFIEGSPRSSTREKRGSGCRIIVKSTGKAFFGLMKTKQSCTTTCILQIEYWFNQPQENSLMQQGYTHCCYQRPCIAPCNHYESDT